MDQFEIVQNDPHQQLNTKFDGLNDFWKGNWHSFWPMESMDSAFVAKLGNWMNSVGINLKFTN
jgi:hypothetical protein